MSGPITTEGRAIVRVDLGLRPHKSLPSAEQDTEMEREAGLQVSTWNSRGCTCHLSIPFLCVIVH